MDLGCVGNQITAAVNGVPLLIVNDPDCWCEAGEIALGVSSVRHGDSEALFNDLIVTTP